MKLNNLNIAFDISCILTALVFITGMIILFDIILFSRKSSMNMKISSAVECARTFFPIFLLVLLIRSFIIQPYRVPTSSLAPTVLPGDFIVVKQYAYGLKLPVLNIKILEIGEPQRGDIALFRYPYNPNTLYVKRVIGLPGDHVVYRNKILIINEVKMKQIPLGIDLDIEKWFITQVQVRLENLDLVTHKIFVKPGYKELEHIDVVVPRGFYFVMGDNRDNSSDSREWGFVPEANLVGKAFGIWMSWDSEKKSIRWQRIGKKLD
ncbi:MAG: signal peptidase I [Coxiellaceae bacterium]|nr:signal peptidase I [Coxiellaceae bacterium]